MRPKSNASSIKYQAEKVIIESLKHSKSDKDLEEDLEYAFLGIDNIREVKFENCFSERARKEIEAPDLFLLDMMRKPENFAITCRHLLNVELFPFQLCVQKILWTKPFPLLTGSRGMSKSFLLGLYTVLRLLFNQGSKVVMCGAGYRQAKLLFEYCERFWNDSPVLRSMVEGFDKLQGPRRDIDRSTIKIGNSWGIAIPVGSGEKIRGLRASHIISDEFASMNPDIYENVIAGFGAVSSNPVESAKERARLKLLEKRGIVNALKSENGKLRNQSIISGTAYYSFNHFYRYWKRYKGIIESRGDVNKLTEILGCSPDESFDWRDYAVIRIPYTALPAAFMDEKMVSRSKATVHSSIFQMEYMASFATDSNGFYKRSLIESCVCKKPIKLSSGEVQFEASLHGDRHLKYIMAVDPAAINDNFSVTILELWEDHRRVKYCWTTTRQSHREKIKTGLIREQDYYSYCARKIRNLMKDFNIERIAIDTQGGGYALIEALSDKDKLMVGESSLWPTIDEDKEKETDNQPGLHIIEMISFAKAEWVSEANNGMRKDLEDRVLLFPHFDPLSLEFSHEEDMKAVQAGDKTRLYDTLEDCVMEIEEMKDELATIVHTQTGVSGRDHWDTPEIKEGNKKGRMRKDRYSSLLMANMTARTMQRAFTMPVYEAKGGMVKGKREVSGTLYVGPQWFTETEYCKMG